jgi:hypothetical protein
MRGTYSSEICKGKKGKLREPAPKCHRVTRRAGHQKVTMECLYLQSLSYLRYPETSVSLHSPQGETDVWSPRGYDVAGAGGGEFPLRLVQRQGAAPLYWRSSSHTHNQPTMGNVCHSLYRRPWQSAACSGAMCVLETTWATPGKLRFFFLFCMGG